MASSSTEQPSNNGDVLSICTNFRAEVFCPPMARILCGASPGDHFTLQGEMLYLPPGKGLLDILDRYVELSTPLELGTQL
jgi:hypothetical protein